ncbi:acyltransferase family protein [Segatella baroniae]|uniref:acyltransferase family protein n=1 Tax=Segatella baroniae TaxID=305719 RepID=UPI0018CA8D52|nr:acyltransferase [Segatella baroniae]
MDKKVSSAIDLLRFPLACLIVFKHYYTADIAKDFCIYTIYDRIGILISNVITAIPVPLFLMISGYLYFNNCKINSTFSRDLYFKKSKRRIKSLLIPYILWNLLFFLLFTSTQLFFSNPEMLQKTGYKTIEEYTLIDLLKNFWALDSTGMPIDGPLWFIRDLFVISLCSPIIFYGIKIFKWIFFIVLLILGIIGYKFTIPFINYNYGVGFAEIFFTFGASVMLLNPESPQKISEKKYVYILSCLAITGLLGLYYAQLYQDSRIETTFLWIYRIFGSIWFVAISELLITKGKNIPGSLSTASFFLFAIHKPILVILRRACFLLLHPSNEILLISLIFIIPSIVIILSIIVFYGIRKWFPFLKCFNGFRL